MVDDNIELVNSILQDYCECLLSVDRSCLTHGFVTGRHQEHCTAILSYCELALMWWKYVILLSTS
jgi:hypothetical protein